MPYKGISAEEFSKRVLKYNQYDLDAAVAKAVRETSQKIYGAIAEDPELLMRVMAHLTNKAINEVEK